MLIPRGSGPAVGSSSTMTTESRPTVVLIIHPALARNPSDAGTAPCGPERASSSTTLSPFWYSGIMAARKMTFSVPEPLAAQFLRRVPSRDRSRFVSEALAARLAERDLDLIRACQIANQDADVTEIERELDGIRDEMAEPWK